MQRFRKPEWVLCLILMLNTSQVLGQVDLSDVRVDQNSQGASIDDISVGDISVGEASVDDITVDVPVEQPARTEPDLHDLVDQLDLDLENSPISAQEMLVADALSDRVSSTEWLGAIGPVALSPFFGLTLLSGIAIVGEERLPEDHYLRRASTPLRNPLVFFTFLILTVLTSVPRFSKVSKPFAQAVDQLETYSAIVILLVVRYMGNLELSGPDDPQMAEVVFQAGIFEFTAESLLMLATVVNIIVVNTVKFFFEIMIWITPVPMIDAMFEAANKTLCGVLAAIYAFSPTIATVINLLILGGCLLVFAWVKRREVYYRTIIFDFVKHWWLTESSSSGDGPLTVFPQQPFEGIPAMSRCLLARNGDAWTLTAPRWFRPATVRQWAGDAPELRGGLLMSSLLLGGQEFRFGKRAPEQLTATAQQLGGHYDGSASERRPAGNLAAEMA